MYLNYDRCTSSSSYQMMPLPAHCSHLSLLSATQLCGIVLLSNLVLFSTYNSCRWTTRCASHIHCVQKKTPTYVFDYNSSVSLSIYIVFVPVAREINTLRFTYLQSWWRHNCVTLHTTKIYFIELLLNMIKYIEFLIEFEDKILIKNLWKCKRFSARRLTNFFVQKIKKMNIRCSGVVMGGRRGGRPERHFLRGGNLRVLSKNYVV